MPTSPRARRPPRPVPVTRALLRGWPLPDPGEGADKNARGATLVVGGSAEVPGAVILAGTASLRAGAGKLQLATIRGAALPVGVAVPEASVHALPESPSGALGRTAGAAAAALAAEAAAVLVGPGMFAPRAAAVFLDAFLRAPRRVPLVLDAMALGALAGRHRRRTAEAPAVLTPHAGEMAALTGLSRKTIERAPARHALEAASRFGAVVALKGPRTFVATPGGDLFCYAGGQVGLATSGSGDVLAGIVAGLLARGAEPPQAAVWAVHLHGEAGNALAARCGRLGFLASELLPLIPPAMYALAHRRSAGSRRGRAGITTKG